MTLKQRVALVAFGVVLGGLLAGGAWLVMRPAPCTPNQDAMFTTSALEVYKAPCAVFTWDLAEQGMPNHTIRYNSLGMHDDPVTFERPPNTYRVLILGDSYAQGLQVPLEQGFPDVLETKLNALDAPRRFEVINLSIDTIGTDRMLMLYALLGYRFDADLVLLATYVGNDVQNNSIELARLRNEGYRPRPFFKLDDAGNLRLYNWGEPFPDDDAPALDWLRRARTQRTHPIIVPTAPAVTNTDPYELEYPVQLGLYMPEDDYWREAWAITDAVLAQFADLTAAQGSDFGVIVIPDRRAVHVADYQRTIDYYPFVGAFDPAAPVQRMVALAESHGIPALNMLPVLRPIDQLGERAFLPLDGHYNAIGHELTADAVFRWMIENGWVG